MDRPASPTVKPTTPRKPRTLRQVVSAVRELPRRCLLPKGLEAEDRYPALAETGEAGRGDHRSRTRRPSSPVSRCLRHLDNMESLSRQPLGTVRPRRVRAFCSLDPAPKVHPPRPCPPEPNPAPRLQRLDAKLLALASKLWGGVFGPGLEGSTPIPSSPASAVGRSPCCLGPRSNSQ